MTITTTAPTLSSAGVTAPSYADVLDFLKTQYRSIFGADVYLESDSQDGQFLAIVAAAINDANSAAIAVWNSFSPARATGAGLSANVKMNGLRRLVATNSSVTLLVVGRAGTTITNGLVQDAARNTWALPASVGIPASGQTAVTATCTAAGAVTAAPGTITTIATPQLGWQSVTNPAAAVLGAPIESDAALRLRQAVAVSQQAQSPLVSVLAAVAAIAGVTRYAAYENQYDSPDANSIPGHALAVVVEGGDAASIAAAIASKKTLGTTSYGSISQTVYDPYGIPRQISFFPVTRRRLTVAITLRAINGYTAAVGAKIQTAIATYINRTVIGQNLYATRLFGPANLTGDPDGLSYEILSLGVASYPATPALADVVIAFNEAAYCDPADVSIILT